MSKNIEPTKDEIAQNQNTTTNQIEDVERGSVDAVDYSTYQRALDKEKQTKEQLKTLESQLAEYKQKEQELENKKLADQEQWQQIAKNLDQELKQSKQDLLEMRKMQINNVRKDALMSELQGLRRVEYLKFANLDMIEVIDGQPDPHSVKLVAENFKKEFPDLLGKTTNSHKITSQAAESPEGDQHPDFSKDKGARTKVLDSIFS